MLLISLNETQFKLEEAEKVSLHFSRTTRTLFSHFFLIIIDSLSYQILGLLQSHTSKTI